MATCLNGMWHVLRIYTVALLAVVLITLPAEAQTIVTAVNITESGDSITVDLRLSEVTAISTTAQSSPNRLTVDLDASTFDLGLGAGRKRQGVISSYRYGVNTNGTATLVFDSAKPLLILASKMDRKRKSPRFTIKLRATDHRSFVAAAENRTSQPIPILSPKAEAPVGDIVPADDQSGKRIIVIDPGHGGVDPGAISKNGVLEKSVVFEYAKTLKAELDKIGKYQIYLSRSEDRFVSLTNRVKFAREKSADLFIALHADTVRGASASGMTFYTLSKTASDEEAEAFAQKENKADAAAGLPFVKNNPDVADILLELAQHESMNHAVFLSRKAVENLKPHAEFTGVPIRSAGFTVLKAPETPSILIELGFLSSADDEKRLLSAAWRNRTASALAGAIDAYFAENVPVNSINPIRKP